MPLVKNGRSSKTAMCGLTTMRRFRTACRSSSRPSGFWPMPATLVRRDGSVGVLWPNDKRVAELEPWLGHLALIALVFPKFKDGRAYSQARLLREPTAFAVCCVLPATYCATSFTSWCAPVSIPSR